MIALASSSFRIFFVLSLVVGIVYPLSVTLIAQKFFNDKASGSLTSFQGQIVGSELLAQKIESPRLFWFRPSASDYSSVPSGASNQGPTSDTLQKAVLERKSRGFRGEMLFASGSGLDPHFSRDAAFGQVGRIVESRKLNDSEERELGEMIEKAIEIRDLGFLGEERINVLKLNLKLIERFGK